MWADDRSQAVHRRYQGAWVVEAAGGPEEAAWAQSWSHASSCQEAFLLGVAFVRLDCAVYLMRTAHSHGQVLLPWLVTVSVWKT